MSGRGGRGRGMNSPLPEIRMWYTFPAKRYRRRRYCAGISDESVPECGERGGGEAVETYHFRERVLLIVIVRINRA